jgi:hypothetical protein
MVDRMDEAGHEFFASLTDEQKALFPAYTEIQDFANAMVGDPPSHEVAGAGVMEIAKVLSRFDGQIEDEWRNNLIALGAGLLRIMNQGRT